MISFVELLQLTGVIVSIATLFYAVGKDNGTKK